MNKGAKAGLALCRTGRNLRTVRPRRLLARPQREERPTLRLEEEVALERGHTLVHRRELVRIARAERRALCGVVRVEREEGHHLLDGCPREVEVAHVVEEFIIRAAVAKRVSDECHGAVRS